MQFDDLNSYLAHYKSTGGPALIPIETVAYYRNVGRPTAMRMSEDGRLVGVTIEGDIYATVDSYISLIGYEQDRVERARRFIEGYAKEGKIVTYEPVMDYVGLRWQSPPHRTVIGHILGEISTKSYKDHGVFLTAIVHRKYGSSTKPGKGYFGLVEHITKKRPSGDETRAVEAQVQKVFNHYRAKSLTPR
jgi:hypothetical protein